MGDLIIARSLFGTTMGFHIIFATLGVTLFFCISIEKTFKVFLIK